MKRIFKAKFTEDGVKIPFYKRKWFIGLVVLFIVSGILGNHDPDEPGQVVNDDPAPPIEKLDSEVVPEVEKEKKEDKKKSSLLADLDPQEMLDKSKFKVNMMTSVDFFIKEYEKQAIRKSKFDTTVYSTEVVRDQSGEEFPYSFMTTGRYEEKGTGALRDFVMTLGFKDAEGLEDGKAFCIQYLNDDTETYLNVMDPEDDVILQMLELLGND